MSRRYPKIIARARHSCGQTILALIVLTSLGCNDLRNFQGRWHGPIVAEDAIRIGFKANATVSYEITKVDLVNLSAHLSTTDNQFKNSNVVQVERAASDAISTLTFDGDPLRTFISFALTQDGNPEPALIITSLYGDDRVELRIIRQNTLYGFFPLTRD